MSGHRAVGASIAVFLGLLAGSSLAETPVSHTVLIEGVKFTPGVTVVKSGEWVQWINKDPFPHTVTSPGSFDSHSIPAGGSWKHRVRESGEIHYTCVFHPNMKAMLSVEK